MSSSPYFLALLPPAGIAAEIRAMQEEAHRLFDSKKALRSPPHLTLVPPFVMKNRRQPDLWAALQQWNESQSEFLITLDNFGTFPPRVVFVAVRPDPKLDRMQRELTEWLSRQFDLRTDRSYGFHPHLTVAFKDLKRPNFPAARAYFEQREFHRQFVVKGAQLLRFAAGRWQVVNGPEGSSN